MDSKKQKSDTDNAVAADMQKVSVFVYDNRQSRMVQNAFMHFVS